MIHAISLRQAVTPRDSVGCDQFVYLDASDPRRCLAPDGFVKLGAPQEMFASWRVWEKGAPELCIEVLSPSDQEPITFAEWGYLGKGKFQRRDFRLDTLTLSSTFSAEGSLFAHLGKHEIFKPTKTYPPMTVSELAATFGDTPKETQ